MSRWLISKTPLKSASRTLLFKAEVAYVHDHIWPPALQLYGQPLGLQNLGDSPLVPNTPAFQLFESMGNDALDAMGCGRRMYKEAGKVYAEPSGVNRPIPTTSVVIKSYMSTTLRVSELIIRAVKLLIQRLRASIVERVRQGVCRGFCHPLNYPYSFNEHQVLPGSNRLSLWMQ